MIERGAHLLRTLYVHMTFRLVKKNLVESMASATQRNRSYLRGILWDLLCYPTSNKILSLLGWKDGSSVNHTYSSHRGSQFDLQHPGLITQNYV